MANPWARLTQQDFLQAAQNLLPRGIAWPRDMLANLTAFWSAVADALTDLHTRAGALSEVESDPRLTAELLADWERCYGLPDPCTPLGRTVIERRAALIAKLVSLDGQSAAYYIAVCASLGFAITITEFRVFRIGSHVGDPLNGLAWAFAFQVNAPLTTETFFRVGLSVAGDPLASWGNEELECIINLLKPAHTIALFAYA